MTTLDKLAVHFSSATDKWSTPQAFFDSVSDEFGPFDVDVCATHDNAKCGRYFTPIEDGLAQEWRGTIWMNPPYGRTIGKWVKKAYESSLDGAVVVCLLPARTDTAWWHDYVMKGEIRFLRGRLKFGDSKTSAPFPSALVVFNKTPAQLGLPSSLRVGDTTYFIGPVLRELDREIAKVYGFAEPEKERRRMVEQLFREVSELRVERDALRARLDGSKV